MPPTGKDPTKEVSFADRIRDSKYNLNCVVCGTGSNRTDWTKTDNSTYVACDGHTDEEISDAVSRLKNEQQATTNNDALAAGGPASATDVSTPGGTGAADGKTTDANKTPQGSETTVKTPSGTKPITPIQAPSARTATNASIPNAVTTPTAGQQLRATQAPTAAPNAEDAAKDVKGVQPGQNAPKGVDPTKAA